MSRQKFILAVANKTGHPVDFLAEARLAFRLTLEIALFRLAKWTFYARDGQFVGNLQGA